MILIWDPLRDKMIHKIQVIFLLCSIHNRVYYYNGSTKFKSKLMTRFIGYQHYITLC